MDKIKNPFSPEKKLTKMIFSFLIIFAVAFVFGPNIYAQFVRLTGSLGAGYGYGYGYGSGYGISDGDYRIGTEGGALDTYAYGYGYSSEIASITVTGASSATTVAVGSTLQMSATISPSNLTAGWSIADGTGSATINSSGLVTGVSVGTVVVTATATDGSGLTGTRTITVTPAYASDDSGDDTPSGSSGGGSGSSYCSSVTYGEWGGCISGYQYRDVSSKIPANCSLSVSQQLGRSKACDAAEHSETSDTSGETSTPTSETATPVVMTPTETTDTGLANRVSGRILLQVESHGEAYYIYPVNNKKYYLGRPLDAFNVMRNLGLGATHKFITSYTVFPTRVAGKILLDVESHGEAYYINPVDRKAYYLGRPADAFRIMRELGLGITNDNIGKIGTAIIE